MKIFGWLSTEQKESLLDFVNEHQQYIGLGKGMFGWLIEPLKVLFLGTALVVPDFVRDNALLSAGIVLFSLVIFPDRVGWWLDKKRYLHRQMAWSNKRNDMKAQLDRIEELLLSRRG